MAIVLDVTDNHLHVSYEITCGLLTRVDPKEGSGPRFYDLMILWYVTLKKGGFITEVFIMKFIELFYEMIDPGGLVYSEILKK